jgi:HEAT repeat protein
VNDLEKIRSALTSTDEETRRSALHTLRDSVIPEKQALLFTAMGDECWRVRKDAVEMYLLSAPDQDSVELLLELLRSEDNAGLRNSASEAAIRLGSACASTLIKMIHDPDEDVRKTIIDVMGAIGDPVFVPSLRGALNDPEVNVAAAAAEQLGALGDKSIAEHLMNAFVSRDEMLFRFSALGALGVLAKPLPLPYELVQLAEQDVYGKVVFDCLGAISDDSSLELLLNGFSCRQKNSRAAALKALYTIYRRSSPAARGKIHGALQPLAGHDVIIGLLELFDSQDRVLAEALLWASDMIEDTRFIPLIAALSDEDESEDDRIARCRRAWQAP